MNWLDILLIIINIIILVFGILTIILAILEHIKNWWTNWTAISVRFWIRYPFIAFFSIILPFVVIDKARGSTLGTITSVDKSFWGTTNLYIKTTENKEEKYCIEFDEEIEQTAKDLIGKKVKISYGTRIGLYSTGKCHEAPVEKIELFE